MTEDSEIRLAKIQGMAVTAIITLSIILIFNPLISEALVGMVGRLVMTFLRELDKLSVEYQLMRGIYHDTARPTPGDSPVRGRGDHTSGRDISSDDVRRDTEGTPEDSGGTGQHTDN